VEVRRMASLDNWLSKPMSVPMTRAAGA